ncbi:MAG: FMN-binding protein [Candidatus Omnitrophota bacterium]|nr:FMN-binding protein [Candidatus Omnitrophota bacterium]
MFRKCVLFLIVALCIWFSFSGVTYAVRLLTREEGLKKVFGEGVEIVTETKELADPQLSKIKERLDGSFVYFQKGSKSKEVDAQTSVDFHFALKDGNKTGVAIFDEEPGKWGPVDFIIALDLNGAVTRVEVLNYEEKRGQPIARHSYMSQYEGKTSKSALTVGKDITGVSGATISSRCATFAVKKAIVLYEELYLNK